MLVEPVNQRAIHCSWRLLVCKVPSAPTREYGAYTLSACQPINAQQLRVVLVEVVSEIEQLSVDAFVPLIVDQCHT